MANCGKHFPGHGFVKADSHVAMPVDERSLDADSGGGCSALRMARHESVGGHAGACDLSARSISILPASRSNWLTILRNDIGFDGVIFSDDLSMEGASVAGSVIDARESGAESRLRHGVDLQFAGQGGPACWPACTPDASAAQASHARISALHRAGQTPGLDWEALQQDPRYVAARKLALSACAA